MKVGSSRGGSKCQSEESLNVDQMKSECTRRVKRKRLNSRGSSDNDSSADLLSYATKERKKSRDGVGVPNKDLLKIF